MDIIRPGHKYALSHHDSDGYEQIQFFEQFLQKDGPDGHPAGKISGTTNEEVLAMLIDRLQFLNKKFPSPYNESAISSLYVALNALETRTKERIYRGVEGTDQI